MKTGALANLFRRVAGGRYVEAPGPAGIARAESRRRPGNAAAEHWAEPEDILDISPEAVFRYVSARHDPRRMSAAELHQMTDELWWWAAISDAGRAALLDSLYACRRKSGSDDTSEDWLDRFRSWGADRLSRNDPVSARHAVQALAVLERIASIRRAITHRDGR